MYVLVRKSLRLSKSCGCSDEKVKAHSGLVLHNRATKGEEQGRASGTAFSPVLCEQSTAAFLIHPLSHRQGLGTAPSPSEKANAELSAFMGSWGKTYSSLAVKDRVWAFHPQMCFLWPSRATLCSTGLQSSFFFSKFQHLVHVYIGECRKSERMF